MNWQEDIKILGVGIEIDMNNSSVDFKYYNRKDNTLWGSNGTVLKKSTDNGYSWQNVYTFSEISVRNVLITSNDTILVIGSGVGFTRTMRSTNNGETFIEVQYINYETGPLNAFVEADGYGILWSEYPTEGKGGIQPYDHVNVFRSLDDGATWTSIKEWDYYWKTGGDNSGDHIRHVHLIQYDPYENLIWMATGDFNSQCRLYTFDGDTFTLIGGGLQDWRYVCLIFTKDYVVMPTDSASIGQGRVFRINRDKRELDELEQRMGNLSWFSCEFKFNIPSQTGLTFTQNHIGGGPVKDRVQAYYTTKNSINLINSWFVGKETHGNVRLPTHNGKQYIFAQVLGFSDGAGFTRFRLTNFPFKWQ